VSPSAVRIERASVTDAVGRALIDALSAELRALYPEAGADEFRSDPARAAAERGAFLVAHLDGAPVGCGAVRALDDDTAELKRMYVAPAARGTGLGRRLLEALENEALALGARLLVLETGTRQTAALALYRNTGFEPIPRYDEHTASAETTVRLGKRLPGPERT